jgi:hypothetical protein
MDYLPSVNMDSDMDSDNSIESNDDRFTRFQWIFHIECYHFLSEVHIKEFCAYCIQTGDSFTMHVKAPHDALCNAGLEALSVYKYQTAKHRLLWCDGDVDLDQFKKYLNDRVQQKISDIFVISKLIKNYFKWSPTKTWGYKHITYLRSFPRLSLLAAQPNSFCTIKVNNKLAMRHSLDHCARRKAHEIAHYMKPVCVAYLNVHIIGNLSEALTNAERDTKEVKYAKQRIDYSLSSKKLHPVDLVQANNAPKNC